jgi:hypothetical protein
MLKVGKFIVGCGHNDKDKVNPRTGHEGLEGSGGIALLFF